MLGFSFIIRAKTRLHYKISFFKQEFEQKTQLPYRKTGQW